MRKLLTGALCLLIASLLCINAHAQKRVITGKIIDSAGSPVPNVSVRIRSARGGVTTGEDGTFRISAAPNDDLLISNIGFQSLEVKVGNRDNLTITLSRFTATLDVVTALGIRRSHNSLPYSTQQLAGSEITKTPTSNFVDNLSGKVAGLQITTSNTMGGSNNVILRGVKSLTQSNQALFVVDGVPYDNTNQARNSYDLGNSVADINPEDIESMSVLKGAAASALYGSRGSNGVVLITTKKGSKRKGIGVSVNTGITAGTPDNSTLPVYQEQYGQGLGSQGSADAGNPNPYFYYQKTAFSPTQPVLIAQTDADQATGPAYDKNLMVYNWDAFSPGNPNYGKATPWMPAANHKPTDYFVTPITNVISVSADGGDDKATFRVGYTRTNDKGFIPNSNNRKTLLTLSATYNLNEKLTVGGQINYSDDAAIGRYGYGYGGGNGTQINPMTDFRQWWQTNADLHALKSDFFRTLTNVTWNWQTTSYLQNGPGSIIKPAFHDNPYWVRYKNFESDGRSRYTGNVFANYKATSYLNILGRVSMDSWNQLQEYRYDVGSYGTPSYGRYNGSFTETNYDLLINFNKDLNENFNLKALLGGNIRQDVNQSISASTNGGLVVPGFFALANSVNTPNAPAESYSVKEVDGIFAGATLSYKDMITLDGTIRRDKSSTLPNKNSSFYYPSVSANWVFSKLMADKPWLPYGKLWVNYAAVGGDAPVFYTKNTYTAGTPFNGQTIFSTPSANFNPTLGPEQNHTYEIGTELSFLHNRLGLTFAYYNSRQSNEILPITVSSSSGYSTFYVNGGTVQNIGQEISLNIVPVKTRSFTWNMTINWSHNKNKAISLYADQPSYVIAGLQNSVQIVAEPHKSVGIIRGTDYQYLNGQRLIDANGYPVKATNKLSDIGNTNPNWLGGINNTLIYKNFTLSFLVDARQGGQLYSLDLDYGASAGLTPHTAGYNSNHAGVRAPLTQGGGYLFTGVTADGKPNTKMVDASDFNAGKFPFSSIFSEAARTYVYDASYIKLREVAITYAIPAKLIAKMGAVKGMDLSLTGRNLWIIHKNLPYSDPEQGIATGGSAGQNASQGFQSGAYPIFRTFGANLRVRF